MARCIFILMISLLASQPLVGQSASDKLPNPKIAFLKSIAVPGWGHYHVNETDWTRGKYHLAAEAILLLGYVGLSIHSNNLQQNWLAYGQKKSGVPIQGRSRQFKLAVGNFNSLQAYNDYQLRSRNWDQLFADTPENRWHWSDDQERSRYNDMRSRFQQIDQQLPALLTMMAVNRIISGISAYNRARKKRASNSFSSSMYLSPYRMSSGVVANLKVNF